MWDVPDRVLNFILVHNDWYNVIDIMKGTGLGAGDVELGIGQLYNDGLIDEMDLTPGAFFGRRYHANIKGAKFKAAGGYAAQANTPIMTIEEKLNHVLKWYVDNPNHKLLVSNVAKKMAPPMDAHEVGRLARQLQDDKYLDWRELTKHHSDGRKELLPDRTLFSANTRGEMFLRDGGYKSPTLQGAAATPSIGGDIIFNGPVTAGAIGGHGSSPSSKGETNHKTTINPPPKKNSISRGVKLVLAIATFALLAWGAWEKWHDQPSEAQHNTTDTIPGP